MVGEIEMLLEQGKTEEDVIKALLGVSKKILAFIEELFYPDTCVNLSFFLQRCLSIGSGQ